MGGMSSEYDISLETGREIIRNLDRKKYQILPIHVSRENAWHTGADAARVLEGKTKPKKHKNFPPLPQKTRMWRVEELRKGAGDVFKTVDVVFNATHGQFGEDGKLQALLDFLKVPYTGSGLAASALAFDKMRSRNLFKFNGITVPETVIVERGDANKDAVLRHTKETLPLPPWVVKPVHAGSSVGVSIVRNEKNFREALRLAFQHDDEVLIEEYVDGREFSCGVLENFKNEKYYALPVVEIIPSQQYEFFDYEAKYSLETREIVPADIPETLAREIQNTALLAHKILGCKLYSRSDMIAGGESVYLLETNTLPGLTSNSLYPKEAKEAGLPFPEMLDKFIEETLRK